MSICRTKKKLLFYLFNAVACLSYRNDTWAGDELSLQGSWVCPNSVSARVVKFQRRSDFVCKNKFCTESGETIHGILRTPRGMSIYLKPLVWNEKQISRRKKFQSNSGQVWQVKYDHRSLQLYQDDQLLAQCVRPKAVEKKQP